VSQLVPGEGDATSLLRIVSGVGTKTAAVMPLILAGLPVLVTFAGVMTMPSPATVDRSDSSGQSHGASTASDLGGESLADQQDDGAIEGGRPDEEPRGDEEPLHGNLDSADTEATPSQDGDDPDAPGKSEEAPGHPGTAGQSEGRGQEKADESGQGPANGRNNSSAKRN
jgi:hypothetical protein